LLNRVCVPSVAVPIAPMPARGALAFPARRKASLCAVPEANEPLPQVLMQAKCSLSTLVSVPAAEAVVAAVAVERIAAIQGRADL